MSLFRRRRAQGAHNPPMDCEGHEPPTGDNIGVIRVDKTVTKIAHVIEDERWITIVVGDVVAAGMLVHEANAILEEMRGFR